MRTNKGNKWASRSNASRSAKRSHVRTLELKTVKEQLKLALRPIVQGPEEDLTEIVNSYVGSLGGARKISADSARVGTEFLSCAGRDLQTYELLYANGQYANSIYSLSQSVEKATKALLTGLGYARLSEIMEAGIGHSPPRIFMKILLEKSGFANAVSKHGNLEFSKDILQMTKRGFWSKTGRGDRLYRALTRPEAEIMKSVSDADEWLISRQDELVVVETVIKSFLEKEKADFNVESRARCFANLLVIGSNTYLHDQAARYPRVSSEFSPDSYTSDLGIVSASPKLAARLRVTLDLVIEQIGISENHLSFLIKGG